MRNWREVKVLFGIKNDGADAYFRAIAPASMMRYNGYLAEARVPAMIDADEFDVLILQGHTTPEAELLARLFQEQGKPMIYDVDDLIEEMPPFWPDYDRYFNRGYAVWKSPLIFRKRLLERADLVTCTTPALAEQMLRYNERVRVVPNCVLWADWDGLPPLERDFEGPLVGWFGLPHYWGTWRLIAEAVEQAVCENDAHLAILGYPEVIKLFSARLAARTFVDSLTRWRNFGQMRQRIATFDVGIAWLEDTEFNRCKSPLKALQYGAAGVPVVASQVVYSEVLGGKYPDRYGSTAADPESLYHQICTALACPEAARMKADAWRQRVFEQHTYELQWTRWLDVICEVMNA